DSTDADGTITDMGAHYYNQAGQSVRISNLITTPSAENISVKWNANSDAASYNIYRSTDGGADFYSLSPYSTASDTSYMDETAEDNTTYHYRVSAVDSESDEGILAYSDHGRRGDDTTALSMGADDRWISVSDPRAPVFSPDQDYTVEFYFRPLGYGNEAQTMLRAASLSLDLIPIGSDSFKIHLVDESGEFTGGNRIPIDSGWHHLAVTAPAGENIKLWLDGHLDAVDDGSVTLAGASGVDFNSSDPANSYEGILDEVRFSDSLRYTSAFVPPGQFQVDETTLALWRLNEGSFDEAVPAVYDWSGNGYHGLVGGSSDPDWVPGSPTLAAGQSAFVINELLPDPTGAGSSKEWIELYNNFYTPLNLENWILSGSGSGETVTLSDNVAIPPGGYALLARISDSTSNGGINPDVVYGTGISLFDGGETIFIKEGTGIVVDTLAYDNSFPFEDGVSMELIVPQWDNNDSLSWAAAGIPYGDGDNFGSPGRRNDAYSGVVDVSIDTIDFSYVMETEEATTSFWISNNGVAELQVSEISTGTAIFSVDTSQATIAMGDSTEIVVLFMPPNVGEYVDTVSVISNDPYSPLVTIGLMGSGINQSADILVTDGETDSLSVFNFPFTRTNESVSDTLYAVNIGFPALEFESPSITGDGAFSTTGQSSVLSFMDTLEIPITFSPTATGAYNGTLILGSNDPDEGVYNVALFGESAEHIILAVPTFYATIQEAIIAAYPEDTVEVLSGTYEESLDLLDKDLVLRSVAGSDSTLIEGDGTVPVLTISGGQSNLTMVSGFTLIGGGGAEGGGIRIDSSSAPDVADMNIAENDADEGGGIYIGSSSPTMVNVTIQNNDATGDGGGLMIRDNASPILNYLTIAGNGSDDGGGIYVRDNSSPVFDHLTLAGNESSGNGGAIYTRTGSHPQLVNSIVWDNGEEAIYFASTGSSSQISVDYSIVEGGVAGIAANGSTVNWGTGNLEDDPMLDPDINLQWGSPAIDAGDPSGDPDPDGTVTDMGALYYDQTFQPPNPPLGLAYAPGSGEVSLSWTANEETDLTHYVVYKGPAPDALDSLAVVTAPTAEYVDTALDPTVINYYALTAVDTANLASDTSAVLMVSFPSLSTSDDAISFGDVRVGVVKTLQVTLSNTGSDTLFVDS
ncbi:MAG: choice-of-anchor D domain-containing protein, partial [Pseudomonadales bacterium]|nr:choice-of-anchor D domain-containing protein [Pseudomonadales bacterium]